MKTMAYIHESLSASQDNAEVWHFFNNSFLKNRTEFTKQDLTAALSMRLMRHNPKHFGESAPMIRTITKVLLHSYISEEALGELGVIKQENGLFIRG